MVSKVDTGIAMANNLQIFNNNKSNEVQKQQKSREGDKLESIKKNIQSGTYKFDLNKTASKVADTLL